MADGLFSEIQDPAQRRAALLKNAKIAADQFHEKLRGMGTAGLEHVNEVNYLRLALRTLIELDQQSEAQP